MAIIGHPRSYTKEEDEILLRYLKIGMEYQHISKRHLPHRSTNALRQRAYRLAYQEIPQISEVQNLADLLDPEQKKRIRTRIPSFKNIKVIR